MNFIIKVADFGLSESVGSKEYFRQDKDASVKLPLKWLAPESMEDGVFSEKSDVVISYLSCMWIFMVMFHLYICNYYSIVGLWNHLLGDL